MFRHVYVLENVPPGQDAVCALKHRAMPERDGGGAMCVCVMRACVSACAREDCNGIYTLR